MIMTIKRKLIKITAKGKKDSIYIYLYIYIYIYIYIAYYNLC